VFGFERVSNGINAHYLIGIEPSETDRKGLTKVRVGISDKNLDLRRWAWRSPIK